MENAKITSIEELKQYVGGKVVQLPDFADGQPFFAKLRRPSILALAKEGKIPNTLLTSVNELFSGSNPVKKQKINGEQDQLKEMFAIFDLLCEASFVEPKYEELKAANIELTDQQYTFIFNYTQNGVAALDSFRKEQTSN